MKIVLIAAVSADGNIAQSVNQSSLEWTSKEDLDFFKEKSKEIGTLVMGETTYGTIGRPLPGRRIIVLSLNETLEPRYPLAGPVPAAGSVEYAKVSIDELLDGLEQTGTTAVMAAGGSSIYSQFLKSGRVQEVFLTVEPYLFGGGVPLASGFTEIKMSLVDVTRLGDRAVLLHYKI